MHQPDTTIGILGGMGPLATAAFYEKVIRATPADGDQEHFPVVIWADPSVPDRSTALTAHGPDPTPWLIRGAHRLEAMGARIIATPCNTAHAFLPTVAESVRALMVDMIDETVAEIRRAYPDIHTVGVLASDGALQAGLYHRRLAAAGLRVVRPTESVQRTQVMATIRRIKAADTGSACRQLIASAAHSLAELGADLVVAGCTEFPLVFDEASAGLPVIDPTVVLANAVVRTARNLDHAETRSVA